MKRKLLILSCLVICLSVLSAGTAAYFTSQSTARNVITSGFVEIELEEKHINGSGAVVEFPQKGILGVMPGSRVSKIVTVKNTGAESWIRVKADCAVTAADGSQLPNDVVSFTPNGAHWLFRDGWYYCRQSIPTEEATPVLFECVDFSPAMGNEYQNCRVILTLQAQAVQAAHNQSAVEDVLGWPEM